MSAILHKAQLNTDPILKIEHVKKYYPIKKGIFSKTVGHVKAVDDVNLLVFPGETLGVVGESGCGKSTLGRSIVRLEHLTEGSILFKNQNIHQLPEPNMRQVRSELQIIFQDPYASLNPKKRVSELLINPLLVHSRLTADEARKKASELLDIVGLSKYSLNKFPHEFSGGQRQRIGIARAVILQPKLIVCDEPVSALDVSIQAQILNLLKSLQNNFQLTYLFIAHGLGAVKFMSDRIAVMYLGKIVELARTSDLFKQPKHPYTKALLDAYPVPNPLSRGKERIILTGDVPNPAAPPSGCRFHTRCPLAQPRCREEEPGLQGAQHMAACHYPLS
ncbi:ABC transporter ATP-binding protein [Paenibacillus piri]|uniref:ABC transporter ATP-binding protein n=1 Tax=Paenibacillus piri TaxID=2547395 RepID=A0A4R5KHP6_9BACL|nr:ABC transporter ATP-binding protein [Paenibacillus piri]TDF93720.1 ABC transporter ATP-binding protein [Paenibacillus piri]